MKYLFTITLLLATAMLNAYTQQIQSVSDIKCGFNPTYNVDELDYYQEKDNETQGQYYSITDSSDCVQHYVIPVVFHVFADDAETTVPLEQLQSALDIANRDLNGLNDDYDDVDPFFLDIRGKMNITFALATIDPEGNPTNGATYHPKNTGFGNHKDYDDSVKAYAWDNYKYMNIYVMNDIYNDGVTNYSGVAWYPNTTMSRNNLARIVFNNVYLGNKGSSFADENFQSVFTHEVGHWLNLAHTFEGGCDGKNDEVDDTPSTLQSAGCEDGTQSCGHTVNGDNYMDYTACYSMFTQGQVERMLKALTTHPTRNSLWKVSNLKETGTYDHYIPNVPSSQFTADKELIREGESIQFADISCGSPNKWEWTFEGGSPATSTEKNPNVLYSTPGKYMVTLVATNDDGSSKESTMQIRVVSKTESSVGESKENLDLFVYPNPTNDRLEIRNLENSVYNVSIYDNLGNVVFSGTVTNGNSVVSLESLYTGVYHLRVTNNDGVFYSKVIKK